MENPEDFWCAIQWCEEVGNYIENSWNELLVVLTEVRRNLRAEERKRKGAVRRGKPVRLVSQKEEEEQIQLEESTIEQTIRSAQADPQLRLSDRKVAISLTGGSHSDMILLDPVGGLFGIFLRWWCEPSARTPKCG